MKYIAQIWVLTTIASPLVLAVVLGIIINNSSLSEIFESYEIIILMILVGSLFSIPAMVVFGLIQRSLKSSIPFWRRKLLLSIYSFLSVWITFYIVDEGFITRWTDKTVWPLIYSLIIVIGVWIFRLPNTNSVV
ncbi:hypothetical protein [Flagellimonas pelagia]|uniref:Uncharacterized protein n=1 Tax=Flagellimonas pelagia TaxID=2306998 RepID=A0ABY3KM77_9FLAO|nr:hypothetical protein [Allomuricauda maritima]TXJ98871.1 hypothetical protein FQ017_05880 [Allomuricauda maritima]